jgi:hypothetical protein
LTPWVTLLVLMIITNYVLFRGLRDNPRASLIRVYDEKMVAARVARERGDMRRYHACSRDAREVFGMIRRLDTDDRESSHRFR